MDHQGTQLKTTSNIKMDWWTDVDEPAVRRWNKHRRHSSKFVKHSKLSKMRRRIQPLRFFESEVPQAPIPLYCFWCDDCSCCCKCPDREGEGSCTTMRNSYYYILKNGYRIYWVNDGEKPTIINSNAQFPPLHLESIEQSFNFVLD